MRVANFEKEKEGRVHRVSTSDEMMGMAATPVKKKRTSACSWFARLRAARLSTLPVIPGRFGEDLIAEMAKSPLVVEPFLPGGVQAEWPGGVRDKFRILARISSVHL